MLSELSEKRQKQIANAPVIESRVFKSKDGRFLVHKTTILDFKATNYYEKILSSEPESDAPEVAESSS